MVSQGLLFKQWYFDVRLKPLELAAGLVVFSVAAEGDDIAC